MQALRTAVKVGGGGPGGVNVIRRMGTQQQQSLTCAELWLLHITLLLSADSKANNPKHLRKKVN